MPRPSISQFVYQFVGHCFHWFGQKNSAKPRRATLRSRLDSRVAHVSIESLENRILLFGTTTDVTSVVASGAGIVAGTGVVYAGHDITLTVNLSAAASVNTSQGSPTLSLSDGRIATYTGGSGTTALTFDYTVMQGDVSSDLAVTAFNFNGSLIKVSGVTGVFNANMTGAVTNPAGILQIAGSSPQVQSITFGAPGLPTTSATTVSFNVTFSEPVIGVTASSFQVVTGGSVADSRIQVTPVSGSVYTVMVSGITGNGTLGLNLADNGTIHDLAGNALVNPSSPISFAPQTTTAGISGFSLVTVADLNGDGKLDLITSNFNNSFVGVFLGNGDGTFQPEQTYAVGLDPEGIVVGDVNGDGKPDIITANYGSRNAKGSTVSVLLNNGAGTFQTQQTFSTGLEPAGLALADLNGDGKADLVVTNYFSNTVSILLGNGDGTFQAQQTFATGAEPYTVSVGDLNGDGKPDIVVANYGGNSVGVLMGNGDGTFQPQVTYSVASSTPNSYLGAVSLGDVNGDGKLDILVTNTAGSATNGNLGVLLGNGDGTFQAQQTYAAGLNPTELATADFNGDGSLDVVTTNHSDLTISVMPGNGDGTFQTQQTYATAAGTRPNDVVTGDFTGDGKPDIVVTNSNGTINLFANTTAGSYTGPVYNIINTPAAVTSVVATGTGISNGNGDLNDNHVVTLTVSFSTPVTVGTTGGLPTLALNDGGTATYAGGSGTSSLTFTYTVLAGQNTNALTVAALNLNGSTIQNAAGNANLSGVVSSLTGSLQIDTNLPFVDLINLESPATGPSVSFTVVFNEPVIGVDASAFQAVTGGSVADSQIQVTPLSTSFYTVTVSGVTGNGTLGLNLVDNGQIHDLAGNALTNPLAPISFVTGQTTSVNPGVQQATAADVNADGKLDLIVLNGPSNSLGVLLGNGDGTFQAQQTYAVGPGAYSTTVGDVNGDGKPDIIVAIPGSTSSPGHTVGVLLNNGDGTFQPLQTYATGAGAASVKLADLNGDGKPDLIAANYANNTVSVLLGNGDGTFQAQQTFATGDRPYSISVGDLNGDGHPDLVVADVIDNAVSVLLGNGDGTFQPQQTISMARGVPGSYTSAVAVADLNGDGKLDLIVADPAGSTVSGATEVLLGNGDGTFQAPQT